MSELPSGKSGGIGRERTLNGESTHQTPLPIHLAIESEDHSTDKKKRTLDTVQESTLTFQATTEGVSLRGSFKV